MLRGTDLRDTDHFDGRRFFNPNGANGQPLWMVPRLLLAARTRWPSQVSVQPQRPPSPGLDQVVVTFLGHAAFLIQVAGINLLTDPVYSRRASPVSFAGPRRVRAPGVRFDDLPTISLVLLSHNHYDHCDLGTARSYYGEFLRRYDRPVIAHQPLIEEAKTAMDRLTGKGD
jgi:glyoxylase-like metal-dependent hydrolase (beta-lactamase superfamily II)